jgi:hypothetical protein
MADGLTVSCAERSTTAADAEYTDPKYNTSVARSLAFSNSHRAQRNYAAEV